MVVLKIRVWVSIGFWMSGCVYELVKSVTEYVEGCHFWITTKLTSFRRMWITTSHRKATRTKEKDEKKIQRLAFKPLEFVFWHYSEVWSEGHPLIWNDTRLNRFGWIWDALCMTMSCKISHLKKVASKLTFFLISSCSFHFWHLFCPTTIFFMMTRSRDTAMQSNPIRETNKKVTLRTLFFNDASQMIRAFFLG